MNIAEFTVDRGKCTGCGICTRVCPGGILYVDHAKANMKPIAAFGWNGCWKCEHCLAVCPAGAISIFDHHPEDSLLPKKSEENQKTVDALIANRHSCRRYLDKNVEKQVVYDMIARLANAPNGGNKQQVEFTLIDDKEQMQHFRETAYQEMEKLAQKGVYPRGFDKTSYGQMKEWEKTVRPDMLFCSAPHLLIPHVPIKEGTPKQDAVIAGTYFELLCASRGLGAVIMTFPLDVLYLMPRVEKWLHIPKDHFIPMMIGFGYPQIPYQRGVQKTVDKRRIHRPWLEKGENR